MTRQDIKQVGKFLANFIDENQDYLNNLEGVGDLYKALALVEGEK